MLIMREAFYRSISHAAIPSVLVVGSCGKESA